MTHSDGPPLSRTEPRLRGRPWRLAPLVLVLVAAAPPEAIRLRLPESRVRTFFPTGTELRGLSAEEFERCLADAVAAVSARAARRPARLLAARHEARWEPGLLTGRSELTVDPGDGDGDGLALDPWTPAILPPAAGSSWLRMHDRGRTTLALEPDTHSRTLDWQLRAREHSQGRGFSLDLPRTDPASLLLDLPDGWIPEGPGGIRQGPSAGTRPGRSTWRFDGEGGPINLKLRDRNAGHSPDRDIRAWASGPTRIELSEASASWTTHWTLALDPRDSHQFRFELDPGLEFLEVAGPDVEDSRAEPSGDATRVTVGLHPRVPSTTLLTIRATARAPVEGAWTVPSARPLDALWTGGRTSIHLDSSRLLTDAREQAGRQVAARPGEAVEANLLVFEAETPRPVAVLVFRKPHPDVSVAVRGELLLGNSSPRLQSQLTWTVDRGRPLSLDVDLPPAWVPDRAQVDGIDEPLAWHPEALPGGAVRVHVVPPSGDFARNPIVLHLTATASFAAGRGPLSLPRIRPVGVRISDERWMAWTETGVTLQPTAARGLAWIDPLLVVNPADRPGGLREALAWRWIADDAEARVDRDRVDPAPEGSVVLAATVDRDRLRIEGRIAFHTVRETPRDLEVRSASPLPAGHSWRFVDEATGRPLAPLPPRADAAAPPLALPADGDAFRLALPTASPGPISIRASLDLPWDGRGAVPLLLLPRPSRTRNLVLVAVARDVRSRVTPRGLVRLDPAIAAQSFAATRAGESGPIEVDPPGYRREHAFAYRDPSDRLLLETERLEPAKFAGVIDQAVLTSIVDPFGPSRHRLTLRYATIQAPALDVTLPEGSSLLRVRRDGQDVAPIRTPTRFSIPLTSPTPSRAAGSITLDYLTPAPVPRDAGRLRPDAPGLSLPVLALRWEVQLPAPWAVANSGAALVAADPRPSPTWGERASSAWRSLLAADPPPVADIEALRTLDRSIAGMPPRDSTLGDWFTRQDAGPRPLVIDRMALESAGWGPKSRIAAPVTPSPIPTTVRDVLQPLGLTLVPVGEAFLATTLADSPSRLGGPLRKPGGPAAWAARMDQAIAWGGDIADRFQSVARWRCEPTPKPHAIGESPEFDPVGEGWRTWRFTATGWPTAGTEILLVNVQDRSAWGGAAALATLLLGLAIRGRPARLRVSLLVIALSAAWLVQGFGPTWPSAIAAGVSAGGVLTLCAWLGAPPGERTRPRSREPQLLSTFRPRRRPPEVAYLIPLILGPAFALAAAPPRRGLDAASAPSDPILVLFPFRGDPDLSRPADRAWMRLRDYERLRSLAAPSSPSSKGVAAVWALAATHHVSRQGSRDLVVESDYDLRGDSADGGSWTIPVGNGRDLTASLDGLPAPVTIEPGGRVATVAIPGIGHHRLLFRRSVAAANALGEEVLRLPIHPLAAARVVIDDGDRSRRATVIGARGTVAVAAGRVEGMLGPCDLLDVRWPSPSPAAVAGRLGTVDGLLLWDAEPAGDRLRARLTFRNPGGTSIVRLRLEPGLFVRSQAIPGLADVTWQGTAEHPEWVASIAPPLPDGAAISLEFWRPRPGRDPGPTPAPRTLPAFLPLDVERFTGAVGFRRPPHWSGRLAPGVGADAISEEAFVRAWGNLPDEPLTLSGATRFPRGAAIAASTHPRPPLLSVTPELQLQLAAGRIDLELNADLVELSGRADQVALDVPNGLRITRVQAPGLTDWSQSGDRVRLRFDGPTARQRRVRIQAWSPLVDDPLSTRLGDWDVAIPWPRWRDVERNPGSLTITSPTPFRVEPTGNLAPWPGDPPVSTTPPYRRRFRVEGDEVHDRLRWSDEPPRVAVQVRGRLAIQPDTAEWESTLLYVVSGGAVDAVHLKLPTSWAEGASVVVTGQSHHLVAEVREPFTFWTIRPEHPIWGSQQFVVRSRRGFPGGEVLAFPDLRPLGRGAADTYLAIVDASGRELVTEGSRGVQQVDDRSRFPESDFAPFPAASTRVYHVGSDDWSLKVGPPRSSAAPVASMDRVSILRAEVAGTRSRDGRFLGTARYQVRPHSGPFLPFELADRSEPLWVTLDGVPVLPLRAAAGRWLIPLNDEEASEVALFWKTDAPRNAPLDSGPVPVPILEQAKVPTSVDLRTPGGLSVAAPAGRFDPLTRDRLEVADAEWLARSIADSLAKIDRGSIRDRQRLVLDLIRFELTLRCAERAAILDPGRPSIYRNERLQRIRERIAQARKGVQDALESAGLDEFARAARIHLGLERPAPGDSPAELPEPSEAVQVRRLGEPSSFQGESGGPGPRFPLIWTPSVPRDPPAAPRGDLLVTAVASPFVTLALLALASRRGPLRRLAPPLALAITGLIGGPWLLALALLFTLLGRLS